MIVGCNNEITEVHYSGYTIDKIYACGGQLVYEATPSFGGKFKLTLLDESTVSAECDATSAITAVEILPQYSGSVVSAEIGDCVITIDDGAFESCSALTSVSISDSVTSIVKYAFNNCRNLTSVNIPSGVTVLTDGVFHMCSSLTSITIPSGVTSIGEHTFGYCSSLTGVTIPNGVTSIGEAAFDRCGSFTSVTIPSGVTYIGHVAFNHCTGLTGITIEAITPPTMEYVAFDDTNNCPIYVPSESVDAYKTETRWSNYADRIQAIP